MADFFQQMIDRISEQERKKRMHEQMTLGQLIEQLEKMNPESGVICSTDTSMVFTTFDSYRGYYDDLALGYIAKDYYEENKDDEIHTVKDFLEEAKRCLGKTFYGWKGGKFIMDKDTPLWVANNGHTSNFVIDHIEESCGSCFVYLDIKQH
jgi:hypothetical protein